MKTLKKSLNKAFTLIELVVVMAVIAILAGVSVGVYFGVINNANQSAVDQEAAQARDAILVQATGLGYEGDGSLGGTNLTKAVMINSTDLELTFSAEVSAAETYGDSVDNALEALYLLSLSETGDVTLDEDLSFNVLVGEGKTGSSTASGSSFVITVNGFEFQNGNGSTATVHFGE